MMAEKKLRFAGVSRFPHPPGPRPKATKENPNPPREAPKKGDRIVLSFREGRRVVEFIDVTETQAKAILDDGEEMHGVTFDVTYSGRAPNLKLEAIKRAKRA
jgi:hypothetical protein